MAKRLFGLLSSLCLVAGCAAPQKSASPQASAGQSAAVGTVDSASPNDDEDYETVFVPPPVGSMLGGGSVRVAKTYSGNDERSLAGNIRRLNAAAGEAVERPFVISAISRVTGVRERELQAQQDVLRLRFGELCAINAIARGDSNKVHEIASLRAKGRSWGDLARANGLSIATLAQVTRNANQLTIDSFNSSAERRKGGNRKVQELGIHPQINPKNG
ncbi:MAG TPA: hypothetical protein VGL24_02980 [Chthoniobacterales bacterium]|jgi:hypothetical protein